MYVVPIAIRRKDHAAELDLRTLRNTVSGAAAAFRCVTDYQPAGGPGDKVFPPTYAGGKYATEERIDSETGEIKSCVLLDSVQSQANRMELALLEAHRTGKVQLPLIETRFDHHELLRKFTVTSLEAPHRAADALFRDSRLNGEMFRKSDKGRILDNANIRNAAGLFGLCPTALIFGLWDSTGPRGGLGAKFQRALVSEIVGLDAVAGIKTASRVDPAAIERRAGPVFRTEGGGWTLKPEDAMRDSSEKPVLYKRHQGKDVPYDPNSGKDIPDQGRPSVINHGNVTPDFDYARNGNNQIQWEYRIDQRGEEVRVRRRILGGFTISKAVQTTVLSLSALRRLRFPLNEGVDSDADADLAARTALAALGLAAGTLARVDTDLRSRCQLFAEGESVWQLLAHPGKPPAEFQLETDAALDLLGESIDEAKNAGLPWEGEIKLNPSSELVHLSCVASVWRVRRERRKPDVRPRHPLPERVVDGRGGRGTERTGRVAAASRPGVHGLGGSMVRDQRGRRRSGGAAATGRAEGDARRTSYAARQRRGGATVVASTASSCHRRFRRHASHHRHELCTGERRWRRQEEQSEDRVG